MKNKVIKNASWLTFSGIVESLVGLIISILTVRYLGPSNYGLINYAASIVSILTPFIELGFNSIFVYEVLKDEENEEETVGTLITLSLISSLICYFGMIMFVSFVNGFDQVTIIVCALYGTLIMFNSMRLIEYWFQSHMLHKYIAIVSIIAYIVASIYKVFLLVLEKNVYWFALSNSIDYGIIAVSLILIYKIKFNKKFRFSFSKGIDVFSRSKYYIISTMMVTLFTNMDRIMIKNMLGDEQNGYYGAALTIATMTYFVFSAIVKAYKPQIIEYKNSGEDNNYKKSIINLYSIIIYGSFVQWLVLSIFSKLFVNVLFGSEFMPSAKILIVISLSTIFNYLSMCRDIWILAEEKHKLMPKINILAVLINFILNYLLIRKYGVIGAAIATLITYAFINLIFGFIYKPIKDNNKYIIAAMNPNVIVSILKNIIGLV